MHRAVTIGSVLLILAACGEDAEDGKAGAAGASGANGSDGHNGQNGLDGRDGDDGQDGQDGTATLFSQAEEPAGDNCEYGGTAVSYGLDANTNGVLDATEVTGTFYICDGADASEVTAGDYWFKETDYPWTYDGDVCQGSRHGGVLRELHRHRRKPAGAKHAADEPRCAGLPGGGERRHHHLRQQPPDGPGDRLAAPRGR